MKLVDWIEFLSHTHTHTLSFSLIYLDISHRDISHISHTERLNA